MFGSCLWGEYPKRRRLHTDLEGAVIVHTGGFLKIYEWIKDI